MKQLFELLYNDIWQWSLQHFLNIFYNTLMSNPTLSNDDSLNANINLIYNLKS